MSHWQTFFCVFWFYCRLVMSAEDRIKELDLEAVNFAKAVKGKILLGNVFQNISAESEMFCQLACVKDVHCLSYNYGTMSDMDGKSNCQLSDSDRFMSYENFANANQSLYRGIQVT